MIYNALKKTITRGTYVREDLLNKMDLYLLANRITQEQYTELLELMGK